MPTRGRPAFGRHAVRLFLAQDYPYRELIVVDEDDGLEASLPEDPRIRFVRAPRGESIGNKRNRACVVARGEYVVHWDDDDWYGPERLTAQVAPLIAGVADVTGLSTPVICALPEWRFWHMTLALHRRLFVHDVHGGTLAYRREVWTRLSHYPDVSLREDAQFLVTAARRGARIVQVPGDGLFVYVRHAANSWRFRCGEEGGRDGWRRAEEPVLPPADRRFYLSLRAQPPQRTRRARRLEPLVSCIMPTRDRRRLVRAALDYFEREEYRPRELVIVDDGEDSVGDLVPAESSIRYVRLPRQVALGAKRNVCCELARGALIAHWDDDDWYAPWRLSYQVGELQNCAAAICGPSRLLALDPARNRAWLYAAPPGAKGSWVAGSGLTYHIDAWRARPFPEVQVAEDSHFVASRPEGTVLPLANHRFLVALIHTANSSPKHVGSPGWRPLRVDAVRSVMASDYSRYVKDPIMSLPCFPGERGHAPDPYRSHY